MADQKRLQGRPKLGNGKRVKKLDVRFTQEEYDLIIAMEKEFGISKTEILRMRVLNDAGRIIVNGAELLKVLDKAGAELGRSGNNINQLAKHANTLKLQGSVPPQVIGNFNRLMEEYIAIQRLLETSLRKIIRLMGK
ncbi:MobC family plasmid mobilization relaxosome protein [Mucilaginibacter sp. UR6-1]|uniref:plasmid mobilization protein n=1 Tax=Mucilaginibacter sp. UR6-1 TaxID=1435643 RepID=UPI001E3D4C10|nr:plasmid mobilization relaxosome protein MobC [Mucilaginibacter sp. UR6-1]MCC8407721.1 MobC family plasmid mobilization relaxosome protein [Mucilaginibacter sp. UR6-1]